MDHIQPATGQRMGLRRASGDLR